MLKSKQQFISFICGIFLFVGVVLPQTTFAQNYEDSPFGIQAPYPQNSLLTNIEATNLLSDIGTKWVRLLPIELEDVAILLSENEIIISSGITPPNGQYPADMNGHIAEVEIIVNEYKDYVKSWQIVNEAELNWNDSKEKYAEYFIEISQVIKSISPDAKIILCLASGHELGFNFLDSALINGVSPYFDVLDFHVQGAEGDYKKIADDVSKLENVFQQNGIEKKPFWITEFGTYDGDPDPNYIGINIYQSESMQASELIKKYIFGLSLNIDKMFWTTMTEWYNYGNEPNGYWNNVGLINNPYNPDGYSHKKLSYFTYKKMTEKLEGSNWDSITTVIDSIDNKYAYKFINNSTGEPIYVAWWDYFDDITYTAGDSSLISLSGISSNQVIVTNAVPNDTSGIYITDYNTAFSIDTLSVSGGSVSFYLKESPVFIEEYTPTLINEINFNSNIRIYPNPTTGIFTVEGENIQSIEIININGQIIYSSDDLKSSYEFQVDLSEQLKGVYFVKIITENAISVKKIVLNKF